MVIDGWLLWMFVGDFYWLMDDEWGYHSKLGVNQLMMINQKWGYPKNGWFIMENPINMDDVGGLPPFQETFIWAAIKRICEPQPGGSQHIYFFILSSFWLSFILHYHYHLFIIFKFIIIFLSSSNSLSFCICIGCMSSHNLLYVENIVYNYLLLSVSVR